MGATAEEGTGRLIRAAVELDELKDRLSVWPEQLQRYVIDQLAEIAAEAETLAEALRDRPSKDLSWDPGSDEYEVFAIPIPGRKWLWRARPRKNLSMPIYRTKDTGRQREQIDVVVYLSDEAQEKTAPVLRAVDEARRALGYVDAELIEDKLGSLWRTWLAKIKNGLSRQEVAERLIKVERAFELGFLDLKQAQVDSQEAQAFATLVQALDSQDRGCVRIGSLLVLKYDGQIVGRSLSQIELRALQQFPAIQRHPEALLEKLAAAVYELDAADRQPLE
ncbi:hypothetical protein EV651_114278 [Kribbella sp. VKM Ac-2571]|nr:hypothetical protein EV651_114278 [Kribbella sp. VKM Ac-2571]